MEKRKLAEICDLPTDCLIEIFSFLDGVNLFQSVYIINKEFNKTLMKSQVIFKQLSKRKYEDLKLEYFFGKKLEDNESILSSSEENWVETYKRIIQETQKEREWKGDFGCGSGSMRWKLTFLKGWKKAELYTKKSWMGSGETEFQYTLDIVIPKNKKYGFKLVGKSINPFKKVNIKRQKKYHQEKFEEMYRKEEVCDIEYFLELLGEIKYIFNEGEDLENVFGNIFEILKYANCAYCQSCSYVKDRGDCDGLYNAILTQIVGEEAPFQNVPVFTEYIEGSMRKKVYE